jgi:hypothetical protein
LVLVVKLIVQISILILLTVGQIPARIINVPQEYGSISTAVTLATGGDTILVAPGFYQENILIYNKKIVLASNFLLDSLAATVSQTVINGSSPADPDRGSVVTISGSGSSGTMLTGFTLTGGFGTFLGDRYAGGGAFVTDCPDASITFNLVTGNSATYGGGVAAYGSSPRFERNIIAYNFSTYGGGIDLKYSPAQISRNMVARNDASITGGAVSISNSQGVVLKDNVIYQNSAVTKGGIASQSSVVLISHNDFWGNTNGDFSGCDPALGDTTCCRNYNEVPCDEFSNIFRNPVIVHFDGGVIVVNCNSDIVDAGSGRNPDCPNGGTRIDMGPYEFDYIVGDADFDGGVDISDVVYLIYYAFAYGPPPCPFWAGDFNSDRVVNAFDIQKLLLYIFKDGHGQDCE